MLLVFWALLLLQMFPLLHLITLPTVVVSRLLP
jgi:hypothetical protein